jgi:hypothetical protein
MVDCDCATRILLKVAEKIEAQQQRGSGHDELDPEAAYALVLWTVAEAIRDALREVDREGPTK